MNGYLGEEVVKIEKTIDEWILLWLEMYRGIDGSHHKDWLTDQIARLLKGTEVVVKLARWENGYLEYRYSLGKPSDEYLAWVEKMKAGDYDVGIAP